MIVCLAIKSLLSSSLKEHPWHVVLVWTSSKAFYTMANLAYFSVAFCCLHGQDTWFLFHSIFFLPFSVWAKDSQALTVFILLSFSLCILQTGNLSFRHAHDPSHPLLCFYRKTDIKREKTWAFIAGNYPDTVDTLCYIQAPHWCNESARNSVPRTYPHWGRTALVLEVKMCKSLCHICLTTLHMGFFLWGRIVG